MFGDFYIEEMDLDNAPKCKCGGDYDFSTLFDRKPRRFNCFYAKCQKCNHEDYGYRLKDLLDKIKRYGRQL
jgi:hypothetical protein